MTTNLSFKDIIDLPEWRPLAPAPTINDKGASLATDYRNNEYNDPGIYQLASSTVLNAYHQANDEWMSYASPGLAGTFGAGAECVFAPRQGPSGHLAAGCTTSKLILTTALPASVGINQLANNGNDIGYVIRVIGNEAGGSGHIEERRIVGNTAGTTVTLYLDKPLSFTPGSGADYEFLSGRIYLLGAGTTAAGSWKYYDVATNSYSGNLATTNLPATIATDTHLISLSEQYVPYNRSPGEGFLVGTGTYDTNDASSTKGCLTATASAAGTITGQATDGDASILANEYRNFQIRIVDDATIPTAVNQRARIASHTGGASPVYTLASNWTVTPSATAKFVIEGDGDKIIGWTSASASTFTYNIIANTWDTTTFAARGGVTGAGVSGEWAFSTVPDANKLHRQSFIYTFRGGASARMDVLDIAGGANGTWDNDIVYGNKGQNITTGSFSTLDPVSNEGRYFYLNINGTQRIARFDMLTRNLTQYAYFPFTQGTSVAGGGMAWGVYIDGTTKVSFIYMTKRSLADFYNVLIFR